MGKRIICKRCKKDVGEFWSGLEEHIWIEHRQVIMSWLSKQGKLVQS